MLVLDTRSILTLGDVVVSVVLLVCLFSVRCLTAGFGGIIGKLAPSSLDCCYHGDKILSITLVNDTEE